MPVIEGGLAGKKVLLYFAPSVGEKGEARFPTAEAKVIDMSDEYLVVEIDGPRTVVFSWDHIVGMQTPGPYKRPEPKVSRIGPTLKP